VLSPAEGECSLVDVFISYSRENKPMVRVLADAVRDEGYSVWWDDEIPPHLAYGDVITEKIGSAKAAIVVWSPSAAASEWVRAEADVARGQKKLIQTTIDGCEPPLPFNQIQVADISGWGGEAEHPGWRRVKESLAALCGASDPTSIPRQVAVPPRALSPPAPAPARQHTTLIVALLAVLVVLAAAAVGFWALPRGGSPDPLAAPKAPQIVQSGTDSAGVARLAWPNGRPVRPPPPLPPQATSAPQQADPPQSLPMSGSRLLTEADIEGLSRNELRIARNEIFARHGRIFRDPELRAHFERFSWYNPQADEVALSPIEEANVRFLQDEDAQR
jgi:hypothetical protein